MKGEKPKRVKIVMDIPASCERMRKKLVKILDTIIDARLRDGEAIAAGKPGGWRHLSAALATIRRDLRPKPETLAWFFELEYYLDSDPNYYYHRTPVAKEGTQP